MLRAFFRGCRVLSMPQVVGSYMVVASGLCSCAPQTIDLSNPKVVATLKEEVKQSLKSELHQCTDKDTLPELENIPDVTEPNLQKGDVPLMVDKDGKGFIYAIVNSAIRIKLLVDTGASITNIPRQLIHKLGCKGAITDQDVVDATWVSLPDGTLELVPVVSVQLTIIERGLTEGQEITSTIGHLNVITLPVMYLLGRNLVRSVDFANHALTPISPEHCMPPQPFWDADTSSCVESIPKGTMTRIMTYFCRAHPEESVCTNRDFQ
jgi:hypothetical protein